MKIKRVDEIAAWRLCLGCGACAYICPDNAISLLDLLDEGIRPVVEQEDCGSCTLCLDVCPAFVNDHTGINARPGIIQELAPAFGPILELWEGYATDPEIRRGGSSGGLLTALSLFCLQHRDMHGVVHIGGDPDDPLKNRTWMSHTREELRERSGSRYAPASACDSLGLIEEAPAPCVFIGQPSEVTALRKAEALRPILAEKVGLTMSFLCAGSPARLGTVNLLKEMGIQPEKVAALRYRGNGWPGNFAVTLKGKAEPTHFRTYKESWSYVQQYRPLSTHLCPDGSGEDADISCGDPWYRDIEPDEPGSSIVIVRTETGRRVLEEAMKSGCVRLTPAEPWKLSRSQQNLIEKRGAVGGRILTLLAMGVPVTHLRGFSLLENWLRLPMKEKLRSTVGTIKRAVLKGYYQPNRTHARNPAARVPNPVD